ncbi:MAG: hypothetical protein ABI305_04125 [Tepidiformaceae bacterium]
MTTQAEGRWWWADAAHGRVEQDTPAIVATNNGYAASYGAMGTAVVVFDGLYRWSGNASGNAPLYQKAEIRVDAEGQPERQWIGTVGVLGPLPDATVEGFVARLRVAGGADAVVAETTHAQVAGRDTLVVETSRAGSAAITRYWVDPHRLFVMKTSFDTGDGQVAETAEITHLSYGGALDAALFSWVAPTGAVENTCHPLASDMMAGRFPAPFLDVPASAIPEGLSVANFGTATGKDGACSEAHTELRAQPSAGSADEPFVQIAQNCERPDSVVSGNREDVRTLSNRTVDAYLWHEGDVVLLAWVHDGLGVQLKSNSLSEVELVAFGEAMLAPLPN